MLIYLLIRFWTQSINKVIQSCEFWLHIWILHPRITIDISFQSICSFSSWVTVSFRVAPRLTHVAQITEINTMNIDILPASCARATQVADTSFPHSGLRLSVGEKLPLIFVELPFYNTYTSYVVDNVIFGICVPDYPRRTVEITFLG